jgi:hypothetical protein
MPSNAGYVLHSDPQWVDFHLSNSVGGRVAYCRGAGAPVRNVERGGKLFFMRRGDGRQRVIFWADLVSADLVSIDDAWPRYGTALGAESDDDWMRLVSRLPSVRDRGNLIVVLGGNMTVPDAPVPLSEVGVRGVKRATKGWGIDAADVLRILGHNRGASRQLEDPDLESFSGSAEGRRRLRVHLQIERNRALVKRAKDKWAEEEPLLRCACCGMSFREKYGFSFVESHHLSPLSELSSGDETVTRIEDLAPVCSNCHSALTLSEFRTIEALRDHLSLSRGSVTVASEGVPASTN